MRIFLVLLLTTSQAFAEGGHGSIKDIMWPAFNFFIFFGFLFWKMKKPLQDNFNKNADLTKELYEYAQAKYQEAEKKIIAYEQKMNRLGEQVENIKKEMLEEVETFKKNLQEETNKNMERAETDAQKRIESEKNKMIHDLEESLLDMVITKTKTKISGDENLKSKATEKMLSAI